MKLFLITLLSAMVGFSAQALDLDSARASKAVRELPTGYVEAVDPTAKSLVDEVNTKRKQTYEELAKKNGLPVEQVAAQGAKKIQEKLKNK